MRTQRVKAAIYVRISKDREGSNLGVQRQEEDCRALARSLGWDVADVYSDNDVSAYSGRLRPAYRRLLEDIRSGAIDAVLVWHTDRLHRSPVELEAYVDLGVQTMTVRAGELDLATPGGRAIARTLGAWARYESEHKGERLTRKYQEMAEAGVPRGNSRPFGYEADNVTPHSTEAAEIRSMVKKVLAGESLASILRDLNGRGVLTSRGKGWGYSSLRAMLLRPRNAGLMVYRSEIIGKGKWQPLVSEEDHLAVQMLLARPERRTTTGNARAHLLPGLARCGKCGQGMKSGNVKDRYKRNNRIYRCCVYRNESKLDALVTKVALLCLVHPDMRRALQPMASLSDGSQAERDAIANRLDEAANAFGQGAITMAQLTTMTRTLKGRLEILDSALAGNTRLRVLDDLMTAKDVLKAWDELPLCRKRTVIDALMTIEVLPVGRASNGTSFLDGVRITLKVANGQELLDALLDPRTDSTQVARIANAFAA